MSNRLRVLIVDDSRIARSAIEQTFAGEPGFEVIGSVFNGEKALAAIADNPPDLVTLDLEMPGQHGLETLMAIRRLSASLGQEIGVMIVSSHTAGNASMTVKALQTGAFDVVLKPSAAAGDSALSQFKQQLLSKAYAYANRRLRLNATSYPQAADSTTAQGIPHSPPPTTALVSGSGLVGSLTKQSKPKVSRHVRAVVIASSTGGPQALPEVLRPLIRRDWPVFLVQHMPIGFTSPLAANLSTKLEQTVVEAVEGLSPQAGTVYLAPAGRHMLLRPLGGEAVIGLSDQPPENGCRPAGDVLFRSTAAIYGPDVVAIILTGMGTDGKAGAMSVRQAGGYVIAQDEATSVVWGMPGAAVSAGAVHEVLPLGEISQAVLRVAGVSA